MARDRITLEEVAPDLRDAVRRLPRLPTQFSIVRRFVRWAAKRLPAYSVPDVAIRTVTDRGTVLRIYEPAVRKTNGALFWIHGGGFLIGTPAQNDQLCAETAQALGMVVVSTSYRLAPENPFPAALDDCRASWHRVQASPHTGWASLRRSMYVPYVVDAYRPKSEASATPAYMRLFDAIMRWKRARAQRRLTG